MKLIPIGIENFKEMIDKNYYYIDKTNLIIDFLNEQVIFCTRPRRFGKTLNMSMLYYPLYGYAFSSLRIKVRMRRLLK